MQIPHFDGHYLVNETNELIHNYVNLQLFLHENFVCNLATFLAWIFV